MLTEFVFLILGTILGLIFPEWYKNFHKWYLTKKKLKRDKALNNMKLINWLQKYHEYHSKKYGIPNELPTCKIGGFTQKVPYLSKKEWDISDDLDDLYKIEIDRDIILQYDDIIREDFEINEKLIEQRKRIGKEIWNADSLYLDRISYEGNIPIFHVKKCKYYASATNMIKLENETINAVNKNSFDKCKMRRQYYLTTHNIENNLLIPVTMGCLVVFALKFEDGYKIILQTRSERTLTSNSVTAIAPTFGLSPFIGDAPPNKGIIYYNFIREYLEELHCVKEVERLKKEHLICRPPEAYNEWIYNMEPTKKLIECKDFSLYYIGFGFNLTNGNSNIGLLAKLDDLKISQYIKNSIFYNWEINNISFVNSNSEKLGELFHKNQIDPASSFFLSKALKYLV